MFSKTTTKLYNNWTTSPDGSLVESKVKVYINKDGSYDVDCESGTNLGLVLGLDYKSQYIIIKGMKDTSIPNVRNIVRLGDILTSINGHIVLNEEFEDISMFFKMLKLGYTALRVKFINPQTLSIEHFLERQRLQNKSCKDIYGFNRTIEYLLQEKKTVFSQKNIIHNRDQEWVEYLKSIGGPENLKPVGTFKPSQDLKEMCRRGIPAAFRQLVWQKISGSSVYKNSFPADYYRSLLARSTEVPEKVLGDIEKDVERTFPDHDFFQKGKGVEGMRRILHAFAIHNTDVGYCQSLNFLSGLMLLFMDEESAFWLLATVVDKLLPGDYFTRTMVGTYVDQFVLAHLIKKYLPKVHKVLDSSQLQLPLITVQWFMCLFVNTLRAEVALRVWDMFLNEGSKVLFRISIALFKMSEKSLLSTTDPGDLFKILRSIGPEIADPDVLIATAYRSYQKPEKSRNSRKFNGNPRLRCKPERGAVPHVLTGFGLAHTGPLQSPDETKEPEKLVTRMDPEEKELIQISRTMSSRLVRPPPSSTLIPDQSTKKLSVDSYLPRRLIRRAGHCSFKRGEIDQLRTEFRPELELRFETMEQSRRQYRELQAQSELASPLADACSLPLASKNAEEELPPNLIDLIVTSSAAVLSSIAALPLGAAEPSTAEVMQPEIEGQDVDTETETEGQFEGGMMTPSPQPFDCPHEPEQPAVPADKMNAASPALWGYLFPKAEPTAARPSAGSAQG